MIRGSGEFGWMRSAVMRYLEMTPAGHLSQDKLVYSLFLKCRIKHFLSELKQFEDRCNIKFTPNEKMQMINVIPVQPVDVHIVVIVFYPYQQIVEECPERMSSEMVEELVSIVTSTLLSFV